MYNCYCRKTSVSYKELEERKNRLKGLEKLYADMALQKELQVSTVHILNFWRRSILITFSFLFFVNIFSIKVQLYKLNALYYILEKGQEAKASWRWGCQSNIKTSIQVAARKKTLKRLGKAPYNLIFLSYRLTNLSIYTMAAGTWIYLLMS